MGMHLKEYTNQELSKIVAKAGFKDIGGLVDVKREVKNAIMVPLLEPDMAAKYGVKPSKGILLFGPPGCGKTLMLRAVASDLNIDMIGIKCSDVMSKWYGESENLIASLFKEAKARAPCILFLDEIDSIAKRRDFYSTDDVTPRVLSIMLSEMDGMEAAEGVIVVATTNMPDLVDPALMRPGRFDKVIYVPPPDEVSRREIMKIHLLNRYVSKGIDASVIAKRTEGFSGADLANLVTEASTLSLDQDYCQRPKLQPDTRLNRYHLL
jgi:SpoVK/Ycf46/Vps4 family AAA+-type ATPase